MICSRAANGTRRRRRGRFNSNSLRNVISSNHFNDLSAAGRLRPQDIGDALMADLVAFRLHGVGDRAERLSLGAERDHVADRLLLAGVLDEVAVVADAPAKGANATKIAAARLLIGLHLPDALADAVALGLRERRGDRQEQLG